jgi:hypothetical protein
MRSPYLCACGCGDNVKVSGAYVPGHESPAAAKKYQELKDHNIAAIRAAKAAKVKTPPHYGRGAGQPVGPAVPLPKGPAPNFGRGAK